MTCAHGNSGLNWRHWHNFLEEDQMKWAKCTLGSHCVFCLHPCARCHMCDVYDTWNLVRMRHMPTCISKKPIEISPPCITLQAHRWSWSAWLPKFQWHIIWCALSCVAGYLRWKGTSGVWTNSQWKNWKKSRSVRPERETLAPAAVLCAAEAGMVDGLEMVDGEVWG